MGSGVSVDDKIQFAAPAATLAVDGREHPHGTDIDRVVAPNESVVAEILKNFVIYSPVWVRDFMV